MHGGLRPVRGAGERLAAVPVAAAASSATGIVNVSRVPRPGPPLSAEMRPPCASTSPLADGQAQAVSRGASAPVAAGDPGVLPEQVRQLLRRHAAAFVGHRDRHVHAVRGRRHADG